MGGHVSTPGSAARTPGRLIGVWLRLGTHSPRAAVGGGASPGPLHGPPGSRGVPTASLTHPAWERGRVASLPVARLSAATKWGRGRSEVRGVGG